MHQPHLVRQGAEEDILGPPMEKLPSPPPEQDQQDLPDQQQQVLQAEDEGAPAEEEAEAEEVRAPVAAVDENEEAGLEENEAASAAAEEEEEEEAGPLAAAEEDEDEQQPENAPTEEEEQAAEASTVEDQEVAAAENASSDTESDGLESQEEEDEEVVRGRGGAAEEEVPVEAEDLDTTEEEEVEEVSQEVESPDARAEVDAEAEVLADTEAEVLAEAGTDAAVEFEPEDEAGARLETDSSPDDDGVDVRSTSQVEEVLALVSDDDEADTAVVEDALVETEETEADKVMETSQGANAMMERLSEPEDAQSDTDSEAAEAETTENAANAMEDVATELVEAAADCQGDADFGLESEEDGEGLRVEEAEEDDELEDERAEGEQVEKEEAEEGGGHLKEEAEEGGGHLKEEETGDQEAEVKEANDVVQVSEKGTSTEFYDQLRAAENGSEGAEAEQGVDDAEEERLGVLVAETEEPDPDPDPPRENAATPEADEPSSSGTSNTSTASAERHQDDEEDDGEVCNRDDEGTSPPRSPPAPVVVPPAGTGTSSAGPALLRKSSSRDYSRVMCETLTSYEQQQRKVAVLERQASMRASHRSYNTNATAGPRKAGFGGYFSHHLFGCFPGRRSSRGGSSLQLIPNLVLAPDGAAGVAEIIGRAGGTVVGGAAVAARCGSTKGSRTSFSRVPADAARGSYSEPTSPQVTCIGQVKARKRGSSGATRSKGRRPPAAAVAAPVPTLQRSSSRRSTSGPGVMLTRSASGRSSQVDVGQKPAVVPKTEPAASVEDEDADLVRSRDSPKEQTRAAVVAQHQQLARAVSQALEAACPTSSGSSSALFVTTTTTPSTTVATTTATAGTPVLNRSSSGPAPKACLWMRRSIGRPITLDLSRKNRCAA